jgi:hypothetical protein
VTAARATAARVWWAVLAAVVALSVPLDLVSFVQQNAGEAGLGALVLRHLSYFTMQSNLLVLAAALPLVRDPLYDGPVWRAVRLASLLGITVTALVFWFVLAPDYHPQGIGRFTNIGLHYVSPLMAVGGWLGFGPWGPVSRAALLPVLAWPALWTAWMLAHGELGGWYPYGFIDVDAIGWTAALRNVAIITAVATILLLGFRWADRWLARRRRE